LRRFDVCIIKVGGQCIGLLNEILLGTVDHSGQWAIGTDTHGLAQRGGTVLSQLRIGNNVHSVLIKKHPAQMVITFERHEALRGMVN